MPSTLIPPTHPPSSTLPLSQASVSSKNASVVISGAGPCGLRAACEAALVLPSARAVHVVELRTECTRHNVLKTWQPTFDDLAAWGLLMCTAAPATPGAAQTAQRRHGHLHVATRLLQICLLKAALLLGVNVHWGRGVCGLVDGPGGWSAWTLPSDAARRYLHETARTIDAQASASAATAAAEPDLPARDDLEAQVKLGGEKDVSRLQQVSRVDYFERAASTRGAVLPPPPPAPASDLPPPYDIVPMADQAFLPVSTLLVAEGESSRLIRRCGFDRHVMKYNEAIGIIVNLDATAAAAPPKVIEEFVIQRMAADWRASCLGPLYDAGIDLENLEYMRGSGTHFIAATTKTAVLHKLGVVRARLGSTRETLAPANVDQDALRRLARTIASAVGIPESSPLCAQHGAQLFDYSCKGVCVEPMRWLDSTTTGANGRLPVLPVGDALQNPYWPQGLGVNRGFHTAIDAVWMAYERVVTGDDAVAEQERVHAFRTMQWQTFGPALLQPGAQWQVDPLTRYAESIQRSMHLHDIDTRARESSVPERYRKAYGLKWPPA